MNGAMYDDVAEYYDKCVREGWSVHNTAIANILEVVGDIHGKQILDVGCGQGVLARLLTKRGAHVTGVDLSEKLLQIATQYNYTEGFAITYLQDDAQFLSKVPAETFDGAVSNLSLMDIQDIRLAFAAVKRVLKPSGWFLFTVTHPCFRVPMAEYEAAENKELVKIGRGYFREGSWDPNNPVGKAGEVGEHHRMLSTYINELAKANLVIEYAREPETSESDLPTILLVKSINT